MVDFADKQGCKTLHLSGHLEVVRELLNHCASVDFANKEGHTPLWAMWK
jgi:ankyrin repeat protein